MEALGKLSIATMGTRPKRAAADNIKTPLCRVMGTARGLKSAIDTNGDPTFGLTGSFLGINVAQALLAGKENNPTDYGQYTSGVLYLPGGIQELIQSPLEALLSDADKAKADAAAIEFALDLFAVPSTNKAGYSFTATLLGEAAQSDPFAAIKARVGEVKLPALPSPAEIETQKAAAGT